MNKNVLSKEEIIDQLKDLIIEKLEIDLAKDEIKEDISLFEDGLGLDSISTVNFIVLLEEEFNFKFQDREISHDLFKNLNNLSDFLIKKVN